jgi:hypothetical protein
MLSELMREETIVGWRKLHYEEPHNFYPSANTIKVMKLRGTRHAEHAACIEDIRNVYKILVGKPNQKRPFVRSKHRRENNTKMCTRKEGVSFRTGFVCLSLGSKTGIL